MTDHSTHDHDATPAARAACRKAVAAASSAHNAARDALIAAFAAKSDYRNWLSYAAGRFAQVRTEDPIVAAEAVMTYFFPSGDEAYDARRRANGYTVTTDVNLIVHITLRAAS